MEEVWGDNAAAQQDSLLESVAFFSWTAAGVSLHAIVWKYSKMRKAAGNHPMDKRPKTFFGSSVFMSHRHLDHGNDGKSRFNIHNMLSGRSIFKSSHSISNNHSSGRHNSNRSAKEVQMPAPTAEEEDPSRLTAIREDPSSRGDLDGSSKAQLDGLSNESSSAIIKVPKIEEADEEEGVDFKTDGAAQETSDVEQNRTTKETDGDANFDDEQLQPHHFGPANLQPPEEKPCG